MTRPHVLGIDDGPVDKRGGGPVPIVAVMMEAHDVVEAVAATRFPVDGDGATAFLAEWVAGLRCHPALQGIVLGGITIAGLGVIDVERLWRDLGVPVLVVNRRDPADHRLHDALRAAGLDSRMEIVDRAPPGFAAGEGLWVSAVGLDRPAATGLVRATLGKSRLPEPLRVAHLIGRAIADGESRGRA